MFRTMRPYLITLACTWAALLAAAFFYSNEHSPSGWIWKAALPAFLFETLFYLGSVFENTRSWFARSGSARTQSTLLWISALVPYLVFSLSAGTFQRNAFYVLALLTAVMAFWHTVVPRRFAYEVGFLIIAAAPFITRVFARVYISPDSHVKVDVLGHLMWIRIGLIAIVVLRGWNAGPVGPWPNLREWRAGIRWFVFGIVPLAGVSVAIHDTRFQLPTGPWWRTLALALGTLLGFFWVVALGEELFFRGVIERGLLNSWRSPLAAVLFSSVLFGASHLWFRPFPDWRRATVAMVLGLFCGTAYIHSGSIRGSMVTHSLVVMTWRVLFK